MRVLYTFLGVLVVSAGLYAFLASNDVVPAPGQIACMSAEKARAAKTRTAGHRIVVAQFGNDFFGDYSDRLRQGLDENTALSISHTCDILPFPGGIRSEGTALKPEHRAALAAEGVDAVVWGYRDSKSASVYLLSGLSEENDGAVYGSVTTFRFQERNAEDDPRKFVAQVFGSIAPPYGSNARLGPMRSKTVYTILRPLQDLTVEAGGLKFPQARTRLAHSFGMAAFHVGREAGDDAILREAEQAFSQVLAMPRSGSSSIRARGYANSVEFWLAQTLFLLGEKEAGTDRLTRSVERFQQTLKQYKGRSRSRTRAAIRLDLGKAMMAIGAREPGPAMQGAAIKQFRTALREIRSKPDRVLKGNLQFQAGLAQTEIGRRLRTLSDLKKAKRWFEHSLNGVDRGKQPAVWAERTLAKARVDFLADPMEPGKKHFERAAKAVSAVQSVWTKTDHPERWAEAELAHALGEARRGGHFQAQRNRKIAADRLRALIANAPAKKYAPLAHYNLAIILARTGERNRDAKMLEEAQRYTERAIELLDGKMDRVAQAMALNNLGYLLELRARIGKDAGALKQSIDAYSAAEAAYQDLKLDATVVSAGLQRARRAYDRERTTSK